jgi:prepilin-type N-terminal cleavage/methylation domain-containing protein
MLPGFSKKKGFTLIELLAVIAIIGVISAVILSSLNTARMKGRDAKRKQDIHQIQLALELYFTANGQYPSSGWYHSNDPTLWGPLQTMLAPYISSLPHDPKEDPTGQFAYSGFHEYAYFTGSGYGCSGRWYMIVYTLEIASGPDSGVVSCAGDPLSNLFKYGGAGATTATKTVGVAG